MVAIFAGNNPEDRAKKDFSVSFKKKKKERKNLGLPVLSLCLPRRVQMSLRVDFGKNGFFYKTVNSLR